MAEMDALERRIMELTYEGYYCGQILLILGQELRGISQPEVVKAMTGLAGGMYAGKACGTLTGAACLIATYVGRGTEDAEGDALCNILVYQLVDWFEKEFKTTECRELVSEDAMERMEVCPGIIKATFLKVMELLQARGVDPYGEE